MFDQVDSMKCLLFIYQNLSVELDPKLFLGITIFEFKYLSFQSDQEWLIPSRLGKTFVVRNGQKRQIPGRVSRSLGKRR